MAGTILFHMKVPSKFWGEALLTTCYLINRLPSYVLNFRTPLRSCFLTKIYSLFLLGFLGVFVLSIFIISQISCPHDRSSVSLSGKTYVSSDVTFFESTSYFSDQGSSLESNLLSPYPHIPSPVVPTTQPNKPLQVYQ